MHGDPMVPAASTALSGGKDDSGSAWPPSAIRYATLTQKHPDYDDKRYGRIEELYEGGWRIQRKAKDYLPKLAFEHGRPYTNRIDTASYQPFFGQILDQFVADLFAQPLTIVPAGDAKDPNTPGEYPDEEFYANLAKNIDGEGMILVDLARDLLTTALKHRCAYAMVDAPVDADDPPANLDEEEKRGLRRFYAYEVPPSQVRDWLLDANGAFQWVVLSTREQERQTPLDTRDTVRETFTIWTIGDDGYARWARYGCEYKVSEPPQGERMVTLQDEGSTSFDRIPLLRLELPRGLWVGNKIGPQAIEHWRRRSALIGAEARSCVAIPVVARGAEMPAAGEGLSETQTDPNRGHDPEKRFERDGFVTLGAGDKLYFAEPEGKAYEIIDKQLDGLREAMYAVNHQMAASVKPTHAALGRSGLSKQKDQEATARVLSALGHFVREFFLRLYDTISRARGEDVVWVAHGLDSYEVDDREQILEESLQLQAVAVPSKTFRIEHAYRLVQKLVPNLPPQTLATIRDEIVGGIEAEQEIRTLTQEAQRDAIEGGGDDAKDDPDAEAGSPKQPGKGGNEGPASVGGKGEG